MFIRPTKMTRLQGTLFTIFVAAVALSFVFAACGGSNDDDKNKEAEKPKAEAEKPVQPPEEVAKTAEKVEKLIEKASDVKMETLVEKSKEAQARELYAYDPINKVDPFSQTATNIELAGIGGKDENILTKYEIRYFRLVGVIQDESQPRAIFEDPRGHAYVVAVGTPIGRNLGVVEQILSDSVIVSEQRFVPPDIETVQLVIKLHPSREKEAQGGG